MLVKYKCNQALRNMQAYNPLKTMLVKYKCKKEYRFIEECGTFKNNAC